MTDKSAKPDQGGLTPGTSRILWPYIRPQMRALLLAMAATGVVTLAEVLYPLPIAYVLDHVVTTDGQTVRTDPFGRDDVVTLAIVAAAFLGIYIVRAAAEFGQALWLQAAGERIMHALRLATYAQLQRLSISYHHRLRTGDLVTRMTADADAVGQMFSTSIGKFVTAASLLVGMFAFSFYIDPLLTLIAFAVAPLLAYLSVVFRRRQGVASKRQRSREGEIAALSGEVLGAVREVQAFASEEYEQERLREISEQRVRAGISTSKIEGFFAGLVDITGGIAVVLVLVFGAWQVRKGALTFGELTVVLYYSQKLYRPLSVLAREVARVQKALARGERIAEVLAADEVLEDRPDGYRGPRATGEIQLDRVTFGYTPDRIALRDLSLLIPAGQKVAVIGRSGAGKSTIAALVARFYDPYDGRILIDGRDARDCSLAWLRGQVGMVLQEGALFSGSVAENIAYGLQVDMDAIVEAATAGGAHGFISELPEGYDTDLGQRGVGLSGGQRQRIAVARTILRNPSILVLDEPTTGLDVQSEAEVMQGLEALMRGRTTVMITHSPALTRTADRVIEIEGGRIARQGTPAELAAELRTLRRAQAVEAAATGRVAPPPDPALPQVEGLLDPDEVAPVLQRSLGREGATPLVRIHSVRYRPRRNIVVHYDVLLGETLYDAVAIAAADRDLARWVAEPSYRQLAEMVDGRTPARDPLSYAPEVEAIIQWLPLDIAMPVLAHDPGQLRLRLQAAGVDIAAGGDGPRLLAYEPRRRAVVRLDGHVIKVRAEERSFAAAVAALDHASRLDSVRTARSEGVLRELQLTCETLLRGTEADPLVDAAAAGSLVASLHASQVDGLRTFSASNQLKAAALAVTSVTEVVPELDDRLQAFLRTLELTKPDLEGKVTAHGDFHAGQLVGVEGEFAVVDLDGMCSAPPALDLAGYASRLVNGDDDSELSAAALAVERLVDGYGSRPRSLPWYLATAILIRSPLPFHFLKPRWPVGIEKMVGAAEEALHL
ncbi:MAG TPA: ABC transporter transmembrane domain-containing protein [Gaiella sp.]|nr:ABC transporter transmembrane domain-containing protein [Gaiella sp.]